MIFAIQQLSFYFSFFHTKVNYDDEVSERFFFKRFAVVLE